ncbi:MAG TPA: class I tRNA ligase family protein, partial [Negativicutes bacterium]|nr:class I tRNA ligase family protein [Negativicutes bacterium]
SSKKAWYVAAADFVNTQDGTGIVHTAVIYGEDDYNLGLKLDLPMVQLLDSKGVFNSEAPEMLQGKYFKASEKLIKEDLQSRGLLFSKQQHTHSYPFCWRCETQLFYNAISAWFIDIQKHKKWLIKLNEKIAWYPGHLKHGRFLKILEGAPDWNISRNRYWATPLPFFVCQCGERECIGSLKELKKRAVNFGEVYDADDIVNVDLHKDQMDKIRLKCKTCKQEMARVPEVIDCWMESASMPFAELHYPFAEKALFKKRLPAQYIAEYIAQTRTWFYYMHVLSVLLFDSIAFENVISTGTILNDKGEKLSKSKKNYTDPWEIINQYGVDPLRFYLMASSVKDGEDLFFQDKEVKDAYNKVVNTLLNVTEFYSTYADKTAPVKKPDAGNVLDAWILSKLDHYVHGVTWQMDNYSTVKSCRLIKEFIEVLSLWYVRRSRSRFKDDTDDKKHASQVLRHVLLVFSKTIAPILPFTAEMVFEKVKGEKEKESVHLCTWPEPGSHANLELEQNMDEVRKAVAVALAERNAKAIKVRQPLQSITVKGAKLKAVEQGLLDLIKDEVNVKEILFDATIEGEVALDLNITQELKEEGMVREMVRFVQEMRKEAGLKPTDEITISFEGADVSLANQNLIAKDVRATVGAIDAADLQKELEMEGKKLLVKIVKQ